MHKIKWPNILQPFLPNFQLTSQIKFGIQYDWMILLIFATLSLQGKLGV